MIVAERQSGIFLDCRVCRRPSGPTFSVERSAASIAFDVHLQNGGVMDEAIDGGERHGLVGEDLGGTATVTTRKLSGNIFDEAMRPDGGAFPTPVQTFGRSGQAATLDAGWRSGDGPIHTTA